MALGDKSFFTPFSLAKNFFRKKVTIEYPKEDLEVHEKTGPSMVYRGFHFNDLDVCIGCGNCSRVCPTAAIDMQALANMEVGKNKERPVIDYGRCCYCAFCVDVCPTGSLSMTRDYIFTQPAVEADKPEERVKGKVDEYTWQAGKKHEELVEQGEWEGEKSWTTTPETSWLDFERQPMEMLPAEDRVQGFIEFVKGFSKEAAMKEAARCIECGICTNVCPAHMDIPDYIRAIYEDDLAENVDIMYRTNPLPSICGRICTHRCEGVCALTHRGEAVAIRWLKRYAIDNLPVEETRDIVKRKQSINKKTGKKVAIIGSGPAGLAAGYYLALMGYDEIKIFERMPEPGGTMRYGIPSYRLPADIIARDISHIEALGVEIQCNTEVGKDITWEEIREKYDAVLISVGFPGGRMPPGVEGLDHPDVYTAIDLLNKIRLGVEIPVHEKIVVIGGGNVAMDIARSMARLQKMKYGKVDLIDTSLEDRHEMPADDEEIEEGTEEGITFRPAWGPRKVRVGEDGKIQGLEVVKCTRVFDENRRFSPQFDEDNKEFFEGTQIIVAIGQAAKYDFIPAEEQETMGIQRGRIPTSDYATKLPGVFAAGDIVYGPDVISAIRDGHGAAQAIDRYFHQ